MMRSTVTIDDETAKELMDLSQSESLVQAIRKAVQGYIKQQKIKKLLSLRGTIDLDLDLQELRNRELEEIDFT